MAGREAIAASAAAAPRRIALRVVEFVMLRRIICAGQRGSRTQAAACTIAAMVERHSVSQMSSEFLRELGVLLVAFGPLDYIFAEQGTALTHLEIGGIVVLGFGLFLVGMVIERLRRT